MSDSPNLALPYLEPSQAQKHVTHNLALERLDALVQLSVEALEAIDPPAVPAEGQVFGIGTGAQNAWAGRDGLLAVWSNGDWLYLTPREGMRAWDRNAGALSVFTGAAWQAQGGADLDNLSVLGINATADPTNRLSVAADATLLNHDGAGHQLKLNKADIADTTSLLFQTGFSGRAEMGLTGDDDFAVKVTADGSDWNTALSVDAVSGDTTLRRISADFYGGPGIQRSFTDTTPGRVMRADWGYGPGNALGPTSQSGGIPTGGLIERGQNSNGSFTRFADGTQICTQRRSLGPITARGAGTYADPYATNTNSQWNFPAAFAATPQLQITTSIEGQGLPIRILGTTYFTIDQVTAFGIAAVRLNGNATAGEVAANLMAIGRWF